jgi:hypothetical protein
VSEPKGANSTLQATSFLHTHSASASLRYPGIDAVPLTLGKAEYLDLPDPQKPMSKSIERFRHICMQESFNTYSTEELRVKHIA